MCSKLLSMDQCMMACCIKYNECIQKAQMLFCNDSKYKTLFERYKATKYSFENLLRSFNDLVWLFVDNFALCKLL